MKQTLTLDKLKTHAKKFVLELSRKNLPELFGVTDGKAVGTYVEHKFHDYLSSKFEYEIGSSASGIDFPSLEVDLKVTSIRQPQSLCPFRAASQKVYGLGYHLMVFVYEKSDDNGMKASHLDISRAIFVKKEHTADYQTTRGILDILERNGTTDDITAYLEERNLPLDEIGRVNLAERIIEEKPEIGYITISNALQWRLQYSRAVSIADTGGNEGVENLLGAG
jgi:restriction system protein